MFSFFWRQATTDKNKDSLPQANTVATETTTVTKEATAVDTHYPTIKKDEQYENTIQTIQENYEKLIRTKPPLVQQPSDTNSQLTKNDTESLSTTSKLLQTQALSNQSFVQDTRTAEEREIDNDFYKINKRSAEAWVDDEDIVNNKEGSFFTRIKTTIVEIQKSFHAVDKVLHKKMLWFFKHNADNSPMSELETAASKFYRLFSQNLTPKVHTVYDTLQKIVGVVSKGLPGFKTLRDDPLKPSDLKIEALDNNSLTVPELKTIYEAYKQQNAFKLADKNDDELLTFTLPTKTVSIKASDLKHFEIVRGNAITLVLSYFFEEDDLHCGNIAKDGKRIDFDMSLWTILTDFKNDGWTLQKLFDRSLRTPSPGQFDMSEIDIVRFPLINDSIRFHWPVFTEEGEKKHSFLIGRFIKYIAEAADSLFKINLTSNLYSEEVKSVYELLEKHPVFIHYKYEMFLKISIMTHLAYQAIADVEISRHVKRRGSEEPIINEITNHMKERTQKCQDILSGIPEFRTFIKDHGAEVVNEFTQELEERNKHLEKRLKKRCLKDQTFAEMYPEFIKQKIDVNIIRDNFNAFTQHCLEVSQREKNSRERFINKCAF